MSQLLDRWRARDGAGSAEVGADLLKSFVQYPAAFLQAMKDDPQSFSTWLNELPHHTFTLFVSSGPLEDEL
jgi:hypothetical protein